MKTSIFDMTFVLPPMVEMHKVEMDTKALLTLFPTGKDEPFCWL